MKGTNQKPILKAAAVGFIIGVTASAAYVLLGFPTWLFVPTWARILFYPGFLAGEMAAGLLALDFFPEIIGCTTVGAEYAVISVTLFLVGRGVIRFARKLRMTGVKAHCEPSTIEEP